MPRRLLTGWSQHNRLLRLMKPLSFCSSCLVFRTSLAFLFLFLSTEAPSQETLEEPRSQPAPAGDRSRDPLPALATEPAPFDLAAAPDAFEIVDVQRQLPLGGWRITWTSIPGRAYRLQRWATDELGLIGDPAWIDIASVRADANTASAEDPTSILTAQRFYRVVLLEETVGDVAPPAVSPIETRFTSVNGQPSVELNVKVQDPAGVAQVEILNGSQVIGLAVRGTNDEWTFLLPLDVHQLGARFLIARATDSSGNVIHSSIFPLGLVDPDHFVPLDANGQPVEGGTVEAVAPGQWGPVEYRPGGRNLLGQGPGFFLRFPHGLRLVREGEQQLLEFTDVTAGFGPAYPIQLAGPVAKSGGAVKRLTVGPVNLADLFDIFGLDPAQGIRVDAFGKFPLRWHGGIIDDGGIRAARFGFASTGFPLPGVSGEYPDFRIDFTRSRGLQIPFHGEFRLPDSTGAGAQVRVGAAQPLWLGLEPSGNVTLKGAVELIFPNGPRFRARVNLDDPFYQLQMAAAGLQVAALDSLADLLPGSPVACLPAQSTEAQLNAATRCLLSFANAYLNFS
ncbi:MAG: hypothetical protein L0Z50_34440, partial [Verrucomicrobiales bacterium]|nr:hypothetical protein [Verrucomicrobiales bacterium]